MSKINHEPSTLLLNTIELVKHLKANENSYVEASLCLNGGARSTHFLNYVGSILYDEGCDGEERETTLEEFANDSFYGNPNARWVLFFSNSASGRN